MEPDYTVQSSPTSPNNQETGIIVNSNGQNNNLEEEKNLVVEESLNYRDNINSAKHVNPQNGGDGSKKTSNVINFLMDAYITSFLKVKYFKLDIEHFNFKINCS